MYLNIYSNISLGYFSVCLACRFYMFIVFNPVIILYFVVSGVAGPRSLP